MMLMLILMLVPSWELRTNNAAELLLSVPRQKITMRNTDCIIHNICNFKERFTEMWRKLRDTQYARASM